MRPSPWLLLLVFLLTACGDPAAGTATRPLGVIAIGEVQGDAARSPLLGQTVTVEGMVTADFRGDSGLGGVFLQDDGDGNPLTSDALFVPAAADVVVDQTALRRGQQVRVHGRVVELDTGRGAMLTALEPLRVEPLGAGTLTPTVLHTPPADWERLEGMWLRIDAPLTVARTDAIERHGEVLVSFDGRLWQPGERAAPGSDAARAVAADNARRRLLLDDARSGDDRPLAEVWPVSILQLRSGSRLGAVEGILDERHGSHRLQLTASPQLHAQPRPPVPSVAGDLRVAAFNLENLFNGDGRGGGFPTERGARSADELALQLAKLVATIRALDPDIAALMELENDGYGPQSSIAGLVAALNAAPGEAEDGARIWRFVDAGRGPGVDAIRVGLIYRGDRVRPRGKPAVLEGGPFGNRSRVPLAQAFVPIEKGRDTGPALVVVANHFKSKGCNEAEGADRDQGDGAACWNAVRTDSARRLDAWLATDPTRAGSGLSVILGDLNAYTHEDPIQTLLRAGWRDAFAVAGIEAPYSYNHDGELGRLDHALLSPVLARRLRGAALWHSNADEPRSVGYRQSAAAAATPWRSSDHDPLLLGFSLRGDQADGR
ncbi:MAG: ExeM/NucH family extracellular endonuclease [Pseudomonadota bacterium]|nr:ExeM/NucH family extracellular endonuclease [Pseudomonadota bacterium]